MSKARTNRKSSKPARPIFVERKEAPVEEEGFRVLIAVHRPRYRSRSERAAAVPGWNMRSLLNKEDPVGLINRKPPQLLIVSDDFGRQKDLGIVRAVQKYRGRGMKIIGLFEDQEAAEAAGELFDATLSPPWKAVDLRRIAAEVCGVKVEVVEELEEQ